MSRATLGVAVAVLGTPQWDRSLFEQEDGLTHKEPFRPTIPQQNERLSNIQVESWPPTVF